VVCRRTGLKPATLRAWEKRYNVVDPGRTATDRRLYSEADIHRLALLQRAIGAGWRIGQIAPLPDTEIEQLLESNAPAAAPQLIEFAPESGDLAQAVASPPRPELAPYLEPVWDLDAEILRQRLEAALLDRTRQSVVETVVGPLVHEVGSLWARGAMRPVHEHFTTAVVRGFLSSLRNQYNTGNGDYRAIVTTPQGQLHEIGALIAATVAEDAGWAVTYLGPNLPAEEIALAARQRQARIVVLSVVLCVGRAQLEENLHTLRRLLPDTVGLVIGGRAVPEIEETLNAIDALTPESLTDYRNLLGRLIETRLRD